jgi:hypothetical protein
MSDIATRWISPFWTTVSSPAAPEGGPDAHLLGVPQVYFLNLGAQAKISINWFSWHGDLVKHEDVSPATHVVAGPYSPAEEIGFWGWMRIAGASPILPWGITPVFPVTGADEFTQSPIEDPIEEMSALQWVKMTFHPEDAVKFPEITLHSIPHA